MLIIMRSEVDKSTAIQAIKSLPISADDVLCVDIKRYDETRRNRQNALYWSLLREIGEHTGHGANVLHEFFKRQFIGVDQAIVNGRVIEVSKSTKKQSVSDFADYVTKVQAFAGSEMGVRFTAYGYSE